MSRPKTPSIAMRVGRRRWRVIVSAVTLVAVVAPFRVAGPVAAQPCSNGTLRIYASWTMQGPERSSSIGMRNGVEMAVAEAGGGVSGYCLEIVHLDNASPQTGRWDSALEAENAARAVADPQAIVYLGPNDSGAAASSIPITNRAHMAEISAGATYPGLTKRIVGTSAPGEPWSYRPLALVNFFRPLSTDDVQGAAAATWAKRLGVKAVFILNDDGTYGKGVANVFEATAKKIGLAVMGNENVDWSQAHQRAVLSRIVASGADLVYMGGVIHTGGTVIIRAMQDAGLVAPRARVMGPDGLFVDELLTGATCAAAAATEVRVTFPGVPPEKMRGTGAATYEQYKKTFGTEPTAFALYAVEAGRIVVDGIRRAAAELGSASNVRDQREAVRKAIAATRNFEGINGTWSFDRDGDVDIDTMSGFRVVSGDAPTTCKFQFETVILQEGSGLGRP